MRILRRAKRILHYALYLFKRAKKICKWPRCLTINLNEKLSHFLSLLFERAICTLLAKDLKQKIAVKARSFSSVWLNWMCVYGNILRICTFLLSLSHLAIKVSIIHALLDIFKWKFPRNPLISHHPNMLIRMCNFQTHDETKNYALKNYCWFIPWNPFDTWKLPVKKSRVNMLLSDESAFLALLRVNYYDAWVCDPSYSQSVSYAAHNLCALSCVSNERMEYQPYIGGPCVECTNVTVSSFVGNEPYLMAWS